MTSFCSCRHLRPGNLFGAFFGGSGTEIPAAFGAILRDDGILKDDAMLKDDGKDEGQDEEVKEVPLEEDVSASRRGSRLLNLSSEE